MILSKYTTEVRFFLENKAGLTESTGYKNVDDIIDKTWNKVFTTTCEFFDEAYRKVLCKKILKHYYLREIGFETVGLWIYYMNMKLEEIMPYYNQLYKSSLLEFNPFHDVDLTRKHEVSRGETSSETKNGSSNSKSDSTTTVSGNDSDHTTGNKIDLFSDTPQGAITNLENETYLTNARKITDDNTRNSTNTSTTSNSYNDNRTDNENTTGNRDSTENYIETVLGKQGSENYSDLLSKFRKTFLNIDLEVINEFNDLFMLLW